MPDGSPGRARVTGERPEPDEVSESEREERARRLANELEVGSLDPDELDGEPEWWDEGADDET